MATCQTANAGSRRKPQAPQQAPSSCWASCREIGFGPGDLDARVQAATAAVLGERELIPGHAMRSQIQWNWYMRGKFATEIASWRARSVLNCRHASRRRTLASRREAGCSSSSRPFSRRFLGLKRDRREIRLPLPWKQRPAADGGFRGQPFAFAGTISASSATQPFGSGQYRVDVDLLNQIRREIADHRREPRQRR